MTDDITEVQTDQVRNGVPMNGPARKWFYQRLMAITAFGACAWWPVVVYVAPELDTLTIPWFTFFGGLVFGWFGLTGVSNWKR